jgi:hypothetical protein
VVKKFDHSSSKFVVLDAECFTLEHFPDGPTEPSADLKVKFMVFQDNCVVCKQV